MDQVDQNRPRPEADPYANPIINPIPDRIPEPPQIHEILNPPKISWEIELCCRFSACCLFPAICSTLCILLLVTADSGMDYFVASYQDPTTSWHDDAIFDIRNMTGEYSYKLKSKFLGYETILKGTWPGTVEGCDWPNTPSFFWRTPPFSTSRDTISKPIFTDCKCFPATPKKDMMNWGGTKVFLFRMKHTNFLSVYEKMNEDGSCKIGYRNCGDTSRVSKGYCIPEEMLNCPMSSFAVYSYTFLEEKNHYTLRDQSKQPITHMSIEEARPCFDRSHKPLSKERYPYPLLNADYEHCRPDVAAEKMEKLKYDIDTDNGWYSFDQTWSVEDVGERQLFDNNAIPYSEFTNYKPSDQWKYNLYLVPPLEWSPTCAKFVPVLLNNKKEIRSINFWTSAVVWTAIFFNLPRIYYLLLWKTDKKIFAFGEEPSYITIVLISSLIYLPSILLIIFQAVLMNNLREHQALFENLVSMNCSTDQAISIFTEKASDLAIISNESVKYSMIFEIFFLAIDIISVLFAVFIIKKE